MYELFKLLGRNKIYVAVLFLITFTYFYFKLIIYSYWKKHNVPHEKPTVPLGTISSKFVFKKITIGNLLRESYNKFRNYPFHGLYMIYSPVLMVNDLELVKNIIVRDFSNFSDRGLYSNEEIDPLVGNLFFLSGEKWRIVRTKLTPSFTSGKLKHMFPLIIDTATEMVKAFDENLKISNILQVKDLCSRYTTDATFSLAFGVYSNTLRDPDNTFHYHGELSCKLSGAKTALTFFAPKLISVLRLPLVNTQVSEFFKKLFFEMIDKRKSESSKRNDFLNLLIQLIDHDQVIDENLYNSSSDSNFNSEKAMKRFEPLVAAAQAFAFFSGGIETSSSLISHCLYELCLHPEVQEKLRNDVDNYLCTNTKLDYESLNKMEFLDMVFQETARKHPSFPFLNRTCNKDYKIPNSTYTIPKGMQVLISVSGIHHNPDIYPDPEKFDPTRFDKQNTATRSPFSFLTFGEGPRVCIGKRLATVQVKVALFVLLATYKFSVCEKTLIPCQYSTETFLQVPKQGIHLRVEKRKNVKLLNF